MGEWTESPDWEGFCEVCCGKGNLKIEPGFLYRVSHNGYLYCRTRDITFRVLDGAAGAYRFRRIEIVDEKTSIRGKAMTAAMMRCQELTNEALADGLGRTKACVKLFGDGSGRFVSPMGVAITPDFSSPADLLTQLAGMEETQKPLSWHEYRDSAGNTYFESLRPKYSCRQHLRDDHVRWRAECGSKFIGWYEDYVEAKLACERRENKLRNDCESESED